MASLYSQVLIRHLDAVVDYIRFILRYLMTRNVHTNIVHFIGCVYNLYQNSQAVKKGVTPKKARVKKDVKFKVAAKKWL